MIEVHCTNAVGAKLQIVMREEDRIKLFDEFVDDYESASTAVRRLALPCLYEFFVVATFHVVKSRGCEFGTLGYASKRPGCVSLNSNRRRASFGFNSLSKCVVKNSGPYPSICTRRSLAPKHRRGRCTFCFCAVLSTRTIHTAWERQETTLPEHPTCTLCKHRLVYRSSLPLFGFQDLGDFR